jgi:hypothetical protein
LSVRGGCRYFELGAAALFDGCAGLSKNLTLEVDGCEIAIPRSVEGVIVTNLPSWAGGTNLWDPPEEVTHQSSATLALHLCVRCVRCAVCGVCSK